MPERPDAGILLRQELIHSGASSGFKAQRGSQHADHAVYNRCDDGNLDSPAPRQLWKSGIVMRADRRLGFLASYVAVFHLPIVYRVFPFPPPRWRAKQLTSTANNGTSRGAASFLVCAAVFAACFLGAAARGDNPPADAIGVIEGEAISVDGPMTVEVVHGQVKTVLRSGSDVHVKAGQARIDLVEGGQIMICGPAHFSMLKAGGAITLALDSGTIHAVVGNEVSLNIYTPQIQAHPISIGTGAEDVLVGLDNTGAMCIRANKGAVRVEQQLTGQSVLVPQSGDVSLTNGQIESLRASTGHCVCTMQAVIKPMTPGTEISQLATTEELKKRAADPKPPAPPEKPEQTAQPDEPIYQVFMPPLRYDAKTKVQGDFDPNLIILVRRVRVRPTLIFQGRVEGDPVVVQAASSANAAKSHATPQAPPETSTWTRVKTYFRKLWSPST